jgi:hypothetical protein
LSVAWRALACSEFFNCKVQIHQSSMLYALWFFISHITLYQHSPWLKMVAISLLILDDCLLQAVPIYWCLGVDFYKHILCVFDVTVHSLLRSAKETE